MPSTVVRDKHFSEKEQKGGYDSFAETAIVKFPLDMYRQLATINNFISTKVSLCVLAFQKFEKEPTCRAGWK